MRRTIIASGLIFTVACGSGSHQDSASSLNATGQEEVLFADSSHNLVPAGGMNASARFNGSCLADVQVRFPASLNIPSLLGRITVEGTLDTKKALVWDRQNAASATLRFIPAKNGSCFAASTFRNLRVKAGVRTLSGNELTSDAVFGLQGVESAPSAGTWAPRSRSQCSAGGCLSITPQRLNDAYARLMEWERVEASQSFYRSTGLIHLPLQGTVMRPYHEVNRKNHYGNGDTVHALRRASHFVKLLFPELPSIEVADLSSSDGRTPHTELGGQIIYTHPEGSHSGGQDVDVSYIGGAQIDWEKNFWFLYSVLQSTGVDMLITQYRSEFINVAQRAHNAGLISTVALARFNKLTFDDGLNHDKHMHISVRNANNQYKPVRFLLEDDVYSCYLALNPKYRGGESNFCR